jgi:hypothetical protein
MVEVVGGVAAHAKPLHHRPRAAIRHACKRDDFAEGHLFEAERKRRPSRLGRIAVTPGRPRQPPTDLHSRHEARLEPGHGEPGETNELARRPQLKRPKPKPVRLEPSLDPLNQHVTLPPTQRPRKVLHDHRISIHRSKGPQILRQPPPKLKPRSLQRWPGGSGASPQNTQEQLPLLVLGGGTRSPLAHAYRPMLCWYSVKPIPEQTAAMIQKRSMILVSDQAIISK